MKKKIHSKKALEPFRKKVHQPKLFCGLICSSENWKVGNFGGSTRY